MKVCFIVNPTAGGANRVEQLTASIRKVLGNENGFFEVKSTTCKGSANTLAREAVVEGFDTVMACGGDGTINEVASALVNTETVALAIVPYGSGNALGLISRHTETERQLLLQNLKAQEQFCSIDAGYSLQQDTSFSTAGFGFDALLSKKYNEGSR